MPEIGGIISDIMDLIKSRPQLKTLRLVQGYSGLMKEIPISSFYAVFTLLSMEDAGGAFGGYFGRGGEDEYYGKVIRPVILLELISPKTQGNKLVEYFELIAEALYGGGLSFSIQNIKAGKVYYDRTVKGLVLPVFITVLKAAVKGG